MAKMTLKERIDQLPELPVATFEAGGKFGDADNMPIVTLRSHKFPKPKPPKRPSTLPIIPKSGALKRTYWVLVTYPLIHCHGPATDLEVDGNLFTEQGTRESDRPNASPAAIAQRQRFYKLSRLNGRRLRSPLWCSVTYGPWLATAIEQESCLVGAKSTWQFVLGQGSDVAFSWYGDWEDMPPYPLLYVFMNERALAGQPELTCCPGYSFCPTTMSCLSIQINCPDMIVPV